MGISQDLTDGIAEISRMRDELRNTVTLIASTVNDEMYALMVSGQDQLHFGEWVVTWSNDAVLWSISHSVFPVYSRFGRSSPYMEPPIKDIFTIHSDLDELVEGMIKNFKSVEQGLKPYIDI